MRLDRHVEHDRRIGDGPRSFKHLGGRSAERRLMGQAVRERK
jgi:hypothetical protein